MIHLSQDVLDRLDVCETELKVTRAYIKALEYGLHAVIASHPVPEVLAELWSHVLPEIADAHGGGDENLEIFDVAFQQALAGLSEHIAGAKKRGAQGD